MDEELRKLERKWEEEPTLGNLVSVIRYKMRSGLTGDPTVGIITGGPGPTYDAMLLDSTRIRATEMNARQIEVGTWVPMYCFAGDYIFFLGEEHGSANG